jgi:hypothetical protein
MRCVAHQEGSIGLSPLTETRHDDSAGVSNGAIARGLLIALNLLAVLRGSVFWRLTAQVRQLCNPHGAR